ncbi:Uncharacterised protein [Mycobacteroides abscessus subsp. abscessus]|nr:Uncharacterised protein [Mycobacteroides abscessus subsp. abscessus]
MLWKVILRKQLFIIKRQLIRCHLLYKIHFSRFNLEKCCFIKVSWVFLSSISSTEKLWGCQMNMCKGQMNY